MKLLSKVWNWMALPFPNHFTAAVLYIGCVLFLIGFWLHSLWGFTLAVLFVIIVVGGVHLTDRAQR
jgi:hypothetical protein